MLVSPDPESHAYLRFLAGEIYASDFSLGSLAQLRRRPLFEGKVSLATLEKWCREDGWVDRRISFQENLRAKIHRELVNTYHQHVQETLKDTKAVLVSALTQLKEPLDKTTLETKSREGLMTATARWIQMEHEMVKDLLDFIGPISQGVLPGAQEGADPSKLETPRPVLSPEEARAAATAIIRMRRAAVEGPVVDSTEPLGEMARDKPGPLRVVKE